METELRINVRQPGFEIEVTERSLGLPHWIISTVVKRVCAAWSVPERDVIEALMTDEVE